MIFFFFFSSRRRHTRCSRDWSSDVCSSDLFSALVNVAQNALVTGEEPGRFGNAHPSITPYQPFRAADGWVAVAAANDGLFARLCDVLGRAELARDERFRTNAARVRNRDELIALLEEAFAARG